jgi:hypothetical protein
MVGLKGTHTCDAPGCKLPPVFVVGLDVGEEASFGHTACMDHLADAVLVTLEQLRWRDNTRRPTVNITLLEL